MRVALFEPEAAGHHMALHVRFIVREMARRQWKVDLVTTERALKHPAYKIVEQESGSAYEVTIMPDRPCSSTAVLGPPNPARVLPSLPICLFFSLLWCPVSPVSAEVRVVLSQGEFRMGDRDTREDAMRLATEAAKRNALEQHKR